MHPFIVPLSRSTPHRLGADEVDQFARRTGWIDDVAVIRPESTCIDASVLPWWPETELLVARDPQWAGPAPIAAWLRSRRLHRLTGVSEPIHRYNAAHRPRIDDETVLAYLGFFCLFIVSGDGPFVLLQSTADAAGLGFALDEKLQDRMRPASVLKQSSEGYHCEAVIWYGDGLFLSNFLVRPDGNVDMTEDEPLASAIGARCLLDFRFTAPALAPVPPAAPAADAG